MPSSLAGGTGAACRPTPQAGCKVEVAGHGGRARNAATPLVLCSCMLTRIESSAGGPGTAGKSSVPGLALGLAIMHALTWSFWDGWHRLRVRLRCLCLQRGHIKVPGADSLHIRFLREGGCVSLCSHQTVPGAPKGRPAARLRAASSRDMHAAGSARVYTSNRTLDCSKRL